MKTDTKGIFFKYAGSILWIISVQYFIAQVIVALKWSQNNKYSWAHNTISDLGNTHCGMYGTRLVCSPLHATMNASFVILGATMLGGSYLFLRTIPYLMTKLGYACVGLAGMGTILVGLFPENTISGLHVTGAGLVFVAGNIAMIILGFSLANISNTIRAYSVLSGVIGLTALSLFFTQTYLGLGEGGMERFTAYPLTLWLIVFGVYTLTQKSTNNHKS